MKKDKIRIKSGTKSIGSGSEFNLLHQLSVVQAKQSELQEKQAELLDKLIDVLAKRQYTHRSNYTSLT
jgi:hypothetical protein